MLTPAYINEINAAHFPGLVPVTFNRWRWAGKGPKYHKFHGAVRYAVVDLESFIASGVMS